MVKFLKEKKVVIVLRGKYAGRKAVILNAQDGDNARPYGHALIAGLAKAPKKVHAKMSQEQLKKACKIKAFLKVVNYNHIMPTRYSLDLELGKEPITKAAAKKSEAKKTALKTLKFAFQARHKTGQNKWFFKRLRF